MFNRDELILDVELAIIYFSDSIVTSMVELVRSRRIGQKPIVLKWAGEIALVR